MKRFVLAFLILHLSLSVARAEQGDSDNNFRKNNPDYRTRAGTFYEKEYLPGAVKGLMAALAPNEAAKQQVTALLKQFIYEFLDQYIKDGGEMTRREHAGVLANLDESVLEYTGGSKVALKNYEAWKTGSSKEFPNPLSFLTVITFQSPPVELSLSPELEKRGWRVTSLESLSETIQYADTLGVEPYQVFVLERAADGARNRGSVTLLIYRSKDSSRLLSALDARKSGEMKTVPQLFWRTRKHVVFLLQEKPTEDSGNLKDWIKRQWIDI